MFSDATIARMRLRLARALVQSCDIEKEGAGVDDAGYPTHGCFSTLHGFGYASIKYRGYDKANDWGFSSRG